MVLPPQITPEQLQEMLNIAAPSSDVPPPLAANFQTAGSDIGYIAGQRQTPYSPEELPEWMANFQQISPTLFAPSQGVFQEAPIVPSIQSTMPQNYADEYADLERLFQESIAVDPTQFGDIYRSGTMLPRQSIEGISGSQSDPVSTLPAAILLGGMLADTEGKFEEFYDPAEEFVQQKVLDPVEEFVQQKVLDPVEDTFKIVADPTEEFVQQKILDPVEDTFKIVADPVEEFVQQKVLDPVEDTFKFVADPVEETVQQYVLDPVEEVTQQYVLDPIEDIAKIPLRAIESILPEVKDSTEENFFEKYVEDPFQDYIGQPFEEAIIEPIEQNIIEPIKESFVDPLADKLTDIVESGENLLGGIAGGTELLFDATGDIANMVANPSAINSDKAVESVNAIGSALGSEGDIVPLPIEDALHDMGSVAALAKALEDPTSANLAQAYAAADDLALTYTDMNSLPAANMVGQIGTALAGLEALDGGIDSVGEAAAVASATKAAAAIVEQVATDAATKAAASSVASAAGAASSFLGPIATAIAIEDILAEDLSVKDILQGLPLGLGRIFGGGGSSFGEANLARDEGGSYIIGSEKSKNKAFEYILPETNAAGYVLKTLEDQYNYEFDPDAWEKVDKQITFDTKSGKDKTPFGTTSQDIVVDALQKGALKPTADSPTDIDWSSLFADARQNTGQSKKGTKLYHPSEAKKPEEYMPLAYPQGLLPSGGLVAGGASLLPRAPQPTTNTEGFSPIFGGLGSYSLF